MKKPQTLIVWLLISASLFASLAIISGITINPTAADYPAFRNEPTREGYINTTLPSSPKPCWDVDIDRGYIDASPVYAEDKVFVVTGGEYPDKRSNAVAIDALTSEIIWMTPIEGWGWQLATPCCDDGRVFAGSTTGTLHCFDSSNGDELWRFSITPSGNGIVSSPVVYDNTVFFGGNDGFVYALNAENSNLLWAFDTLNPIYFSSPCINPDENVLYIGNDGGFLFCLSLEDGREVWNINVGERIRSTPAYYRGHIYFTAHDGFLYSVDSGGSIKWEHDINAQGSSPAVHNDRIYVGGDELYCISTDNEILWSYEANETIQSSPTITDNGLVFSTNNEASGVYCLGLDGKLRWEYILEPHDYMLASPIAVDERIYAASDNGHVYCIEGEENLAPEILSFETDKEIYEIGETSKITGELKDENGHADIVEITIILNRIENGSEGKLREFGINDLNVSFVDEKRLRFEISIPLANHTAGNYSLFLKVKDSRNETKEMKLEFRLEMKSKEDDEGLDLFLVGLPICTGIAALSGLAIYRKRYNEWDKDEYYDKGTGKEEIE